MIYLALEFHGALESLHLELLDGTGKKMAKSDEFDNLLAFVSSEEIAYTTAFRRVVRSMLDEMMAEIYGFDLK